MKTLDKTQLDNKKIIARFPLFHNSQYKEYHQNVRDLST